MLAQLDYLPYKWTGEEVAKTPEAQIAAATTEVPKGHFSTRWNNTPSELKELWTPGEENESGQRRADGLRGTHTGSKSTASPAR